MKISEARDQHVSEYMPRNALTLVLRERKFFAGEQEVPESDIRDVDGWVTGFGRHDYLPLVIASRC
jgi:hypothetical protein